MYAFAYLIGFLIVNYIEVALLIVIDKAGSRFPVLDDKSKSV